MSNEKIVVDDIPNRANPDNPFRDREYEKELRERFHKRVPSKVFDAHFHLSKGEIAGVADEDIFKTWKLITEDAIGEGKIAGGLLMGNPINYSKKELLDEDRFFACENAEKNDGFVTALLVTPWDNPKEIETVLDEHPKIVALKPYRTWARAENTYEADILDYAPEWMWEIANKRKMSVVNHLSHYGNMLKDENNGKQIRYICEKYPDAIMVLAHCAMGHHPDKLKSGLHYLDGLENVWMDCSGVSEALSIIYAIQYMGADKIMYGSDGYNFGQMMGRVMAMGGNFLGIHDGENMQLPPDYRYKPLNNMYEGLLALFAAGDICGLTESQWEDIFYNNAAKLYLKK